MQLNKNVFYFSFHCTTRKNKTKLQKFVRFMNIMGYNIMMLSLFSVHSFLYYITFIISTPVHNVSLRSVFRFVRQSFDRCGHLSDVFLEYEMHYIVTLMHIALQTRDFDGIRTLGYYTSFYGTGNE